MVELVDAADSKSAAARHVGSTPTGGTKPQFLFNQAADVGESDMKRLAIALFLCFNFGAAQAASDFTGTYLCQDDSTVFAVYEGGWVVTTPAPSDTRWLFTFAKVGASNFQVTAKLSKWNKFQACIVEPGYDTLTVLTASQNSLSCLFSGDLLSVNLDTLAFAVGTGGQYGKSAGLDIGRCSRTD